MVVGTEVVRGNVAEEIVGHSRPLETADSPTLRSSSLVTISAYRRRIVLSAKVIGYTNLARAIFAFTASVSTISGRVFALASAALTFMSIELELDILAICLSIVTPTPHACYSRRNAQGGLSKIRRPPGRDTAENRKTSLLSHPVARDPQWRQRSSCCT